MTSWLSSWFSKDEHQNVKIDSSLTKHWIGAWWRDEQEYIPEMRPGERLYGPDNLNCVSLENNTIAFDGYSQRDRLDDDFLWFQPKKLCMSFTKFPRGEEYIRFLTSVRTFIISNIEIDEVCYCLSFMPNLFNLVIHDSQKGENYYHDEDFIRMFESLKLTQTKYFQLICQLDHKLTIEVIDSFLLATKDLRERHIKIQFYKFAIDGRKMRPIIEHVDGIYRFFESTENCSQTYEISKDTNMAEISGSIMFCFVDWFPIFEIVKELERRLPRQTSNVERFRDVFRVEKKEYGARQLKVLFSLQEAVNGINLAGWLSENSEVVNGLPYDEVDGFVAL
ncbi:unnamed protein product [Caenorhabditis angaria]|uniref:Uncharacterized protein n=1 Tax=Caenorhabditis angaria TaxID=860376 RepID=A0A9P1J5L7_9PELO|nr:unnamed protein product [Caenorhabditis angaria]